MVLQYLLCNFSEIFHKAPYLQLLHKVPKRKKHYCKISCIWRNNIFIMYAFCTFFISFTRRILFCFISSTSPFSWYDIRLAYVSPGNFESIGRYTVLSADAPEVLRQNQLFHFYRNKYNLLWELFRCKYLT